MSFKNKISIFLFVLILTISAVMLTGCDTDVPQPTATAVPTEAAPVPTEEPTEAPAAPEEETPAETEKPAEEAETPAEEPAPEAEQPAAEPETAESSDPTAVASVDGILIPAEKFVQMTTFNRYQYMNMYRQYAQMYTMYGLPLDSLNEQVEGILGESGRERMGLESIDQLTYDRVLELEAEKEGLEISDEEVYTQMKSMFGYEEDTGEAEPVLGMDSFNIGADEAEEGTDKEAEFRKFAEIVLDDSYGGSVSFDYVKDYAKHILLDNTMFAEELDRRVFESEQVNARHILVEDEETAKEILAKLEAGEEWAKLASEHSLDTSNKDNSGSLGWFGRGVMVSEFEDAAFALEPGQISEPVKTAYGYHIIASDGKEVRPLEGDALTAAQNALYDEWSIGLREAHDIQSYRDVWMDLVPMEPAFEPMVTETAEEPAVEEPAAEEVPAEEPVTEEPAAVEEPAAEEAPAEEPMPEEPAAVEEPAAEEVPAEEPVTEEPAAVEEPAAEEAPAEEPATEEPAAEEPITEEAPVEEPVTEEPAAVEEPAAEEIPAEEPVTEEPAAVEEPAAEETPAEEPVTEEPSAVVEETDKKYAAAVDGVGIPLEDFVESVTFSRYQYLNQYNQYAQMYQMYGLPLDSLNSQVTAILGEDGKADLGSTTIKELTYNIVLDREAEKAGVEVTEDEVYTRLKTMFNYEDPSGEETGILGMESFVVDPTVTDDEEDKYAEFERYAEAVLALGYDGRISLNYLKNFARHAIMEDKLFEEAVKDRVFEAEQVNARHILVETEETANELLAKLEAGEEWDALAAEYNLDSGTSLGWFGRGVMVSEFENAAFALEPGEISQPVKTQYGYHIIASDGKEVRPLEGTALETAKNEAYAEWRSTLSEGYTIENYTDVWMEAMPTEPAFNPIVTESAEGTAETEESAETEPAAEETPEPEAAAAEETVEEAAPAEETGPEPAAAEEPAEETVPAEGKSIKRYPGKDTEDVRKPAVRIRTNPETPAEETEAEPAAVSEPAAAVQEEQTVIVGTVNGLPITADEFVATTVFNRHQVIAEYQQSAQIYAMFGIPLDDVNAAYEQYLGSSDEAKMKLGQESLDNIALFKMADLESAETGITISDSEVVSQMKETFGYTDAAAETESALGLDSFNLEADEEDSGAEDVEFRAYVEMNLSMAFDDKINYDFWKDYVKHNMLVNALIEKELEGRVFEAEQVHARHILVDEEETALEILAKLDAGEEWDTLAEMYNKDSGTDLGWFGRGEMVSEFEDAAFALEPGEISQPVKSQYGYHVIISDGKEMRPLEDSALKAAQQEVSAEWYKKLQEKYAVESYSDVWMPLVPEEPVFEPIEIDAEEAGIPTYTIGSWDDEEGSETQQAEGPADTEEPKSDDIEEAASQDDTETELSIDNTEQDDSAFLLSNAGEADTSAEQDEDALPLSSEDEEELSIDNTEQDNSAFLLSNEGEENLSIDNTEQDEDAPALSSEGEEELSIDNTEQDDGALTLSNEGENK